ITATLLAAAEVQPGEHVLDVGCGSGSTLMELASRTGPRGRALGIDVSRQSVEQANHRLAAAGLAHAEAIVADASTQRFEGRTFELLFSRFGVLFFADPLVAFSNLRKAMVSTGRLVLGVWSMQAEYGLGFTPCQA